MKCSDCIDRDRHASTCPACRRMQAEGRWTWELDNGNRWMRCLDCGGGMTLPAYMEDNLYRFCPYCGHQMIKGKQVSMFCQLKEQM